MPTQPLRLGRTQWLVLVAVVVVVLPAVLYAALQPVVDLWLMQRFELPALQAAYGFSTGYVQLRFADGCSRSYFTITAVVPGGAFARAGIRAGDIPTSYKHGPELGFLYDMRWVQRGHTMFIVVISTEDVAANRWESVRHVQVEPLGPKSPAT